MSARTLSSAIAVGYVGMNVFASKPRNLSQAVLVILVAGASVLIPLACIWFSDEMGEYVGGLSFPSINRKTPGIVVMIGGWFLLLVQCGIVLIMFFNHP